MPKRALEEKEDSLEADETSLSNCTDQTAKEVVAVAIEEVVDVETSKVAPLEGDAKTVNKQAEELPHGIEIRYEIKEVPGKGRGIFVSEAYSKGTVWYNFEKSVARKSSVVRPKEEFLSMISNMERESIVDMLQLVYCLDHEHVNDIRIDPARFTNHSKEPNSASLPNKSSAFTRDMKAGEEITEDYRLYADPTWFDNLVQDYDIPVDYML
jgi:hypothetical protein